VIYSGLRLHRDFSSGYVQFSRYASERCDTIGGTAELHFLVLSASASPRTCPLTGAESNFGNAVGSRIEQVLHRQAPRAADIANSLNRNGVNQLSSIASASGFAQ